MQTFSLLTLTGPNINYWKPQNVSHCSSMINHNDHAKPIVFTYAPTERYNMNCAAILPTWQTWMSPISRSASTLVDIDDQVYAHYCKLQPFRKIRSSVKRWDSQYEGLTPVITSIDLCVLEEEKFWFQSSQPWMVIDPIIKSLCLLSVRLFR